MNPINQAVRFGLCCVAICLAILQSNAGTIVSFGTGTAVTVVDRSVSFAPSLSFYGDRYLEDNVLISDRWALSNWFGHGFSAGDPKNLDPFRPNGPHTNPSYSDGTKYAYIWGGYANDALLVECIDKQLMTAVELQWGCCDANVAYGSTLQWLTLKNGLIQSSGEIDPTYPHPQMGDVIGFSNPDGFDKLCFRGVLQGSSSPVAYFAVDNIKIELAKTSSVPDSCATSVLLSMVLFLGAALRRRSS